MSSSRGSSSENTHSSLYASRKVTEEEMHIDIPSSFSQSSVESLSPEDDAVTIISSLSSVNSSKIHMYLSPKAKDRDPVDRDIYIKTLKVKQRQSRFEQPRPLKLDGNHTGRSKTDQIFHRKEIDNRGKDASIHDASEIASRPVSPLSDCYTQSHQRHAPSVVLYEAENIYNELVKEEQARKSNQMVENVHSIKFCSDLLDQDFETPNIYSVNDNWVEDVNLRISSSQIFSDSNTSLLNEFHCLNVLKSDKARFDRILSSTTIKSNNTHLYTVPEEESMAEEEIITNESSDSQHSFSVDHSSRNIKHGNNIVGGKMLYSDRQQDSLVLQENNDKYLEDHFIKNVDGSMLRIKERMKIPDTEDPSLHRISKLSKKNFCMNVFAESRKELELCHKSRYLRSNNNPSADQQKNLWTKANSHPFGESSSNSVEECIVERFGEDSIHESLQIGHQSATTTLNSTTYRCSNPMNESRTNQLDDCRLEDVEGYEQESLLIESRKAANTNNSSTYRCTKPSQRDFEQESRVRDPSTAAAYNSETYRCPNTERKSQNLVPEYREEDHKKESHRKTHPDVKVTYNSDTYRCAKPMQKSRTNLDEEYSEEEFGRYYGRDLRRRRKPNAKVTNNSKTTCGSNPVYGEEKSTNVSRNSETYRCPKLVQDSQTNLSKEYREEFEGGYEQELHRRRHPSAKKTRTYPNSILKPSKNSAETLVQDHAQKSHQERNLSAKSTHNSKTYRCIKPILKSQTKLVEECRVKDSEGDCEERSFHSRHPNTNIAHNSETYRCPNPKMKNLVEEFVVDCTQKSRQNKHANTKSKNEYRPSNAVRQPRTNIVEECDEVSERYCAQESSQSKRRTHNSETYRCPNPTGQVVGRSTATLPVADTADYRKPPAEDIKNSSCVGKKSNDNPQSMPMKSIKGLKISTENKEGTKHQNFAWDYNNNVSSSSRTYILDNGSRNIEDADVAIVKAGYDKMNDFKHNAQQLNRKALTSEDYSSHAIKAACPQQVKITEKESKKMIYKNEPYNPMKKTIRFNCDSKNKRSFTNIQRQDSSGLVVNDSCMKVSQIEPSNTVNQHRQKNSTGRYNTRNDLQTRKSSAYSTSTSQRFVDKNIYKDRNNNSGLKLPSIVKAHESYGSGQFQTEKSCDRLYSTSDLKLPAIYSNLYKNCNKKRFLPNSGYQRPKSSKDYPKILYPQVNTRQEKYNRNLVDWEVLNSGPKFRQQSTEKKFTYNKNRYDISKDSYNSSKTYDNPYTTKYIDYAEHVSIVKEYFWKQKMLDSATSHPVLHVGRTEPHPTPTFSRLDVDFIEVFLHECCIHRTNKENFEDYLRRKEEESGNAQNRLPKIMSSGIYTNVYNNQRKRK